MDILQVYLFQQMAACWQDFFEMSCLIYQHDIFLECGLREIYSQNTVSLVLHYLGLMRTFSFSSIVMMPVFDDWVTKEEKSCFKTKSLDGVFESILCFLIVVKIWIKVLDAVATTDISWNESCR